jgi:acetyl esterase/lipase
MRRTGLIFLLALPALPALLALPAPASAQQAPVRISLWANGAPGSEARRAEPEEAKDYWVKNIHDPSITVYLPPKAKANGSGVVIIPGGGHRLLVYKAEGVDPAEYLNSLGVAAFVLKHRLQREEGSTYTIERDAKADAYRAMRTVRSRAADWGVDPARLGVMGFSAGGEVVGLIAFGTGDGDAQAPDPIDRANGRPDFAIFVYPGPLAVQASVPATAPPAFLVTASDDPCCSIPTLKILQQYRDAKVPVEAHVFATGGHGFNMGQRSKLKSVNTWPQRLADWLSDRGIVR